MKPLTDRQRQEWVAVHRETLALAGFMVRYVPKLSEAIRKTAEPRHPFSSYLAGLKEARKDLLEMASDLTGHEIRELDQHLMQELGVSLDSLQVKRLEKITARRTKGALSTDAQFRLVYGRLEQIWGDPVHEQEATELKALMVAYENKVAHRSKKQSSV
jgi:hypothetical protein